MRYQYASCTWPPQRVTDPLFGFYNKSFEIFNFGRPLPCPTENAWNTEFKTEWTEERVQVLIKMAPNYKWSEIGEAIGVTASTVKSKHQELVKKGLTKKLNKTKRWTLEEITYLSEHYNDSYKSLTKKLNRKYNAIAWKIRDLKLPRDGFTIYED